jgi:electron transport complex protein RnfC
VNQIFNIHGGIHPPERKELSNPGRVIDATTPSKLVLPITQHIGAPARPIVEVGDAVLGGQMIAEAQGPVSVPVHAPSSGTVTAIEARAVPHASGLTDTCIEITLDGLDQSIAYEGVEDWRAQSKTLLLERIRLSGVTGLGGAGFPTAIKLASDRDKGIHTLIINGTECEPYITADDTVMQCFAQQIVEGSEILAHIVGAQTVLFAIEDNKPEATDAMRQAAAALDMAEVVTFPTKYPSGGEKQLIEILLNTQVPSGGIPADLGVLCQNPSTAIAVRDAIIDGRPLTHRITTVTGMSLNEPGNRRVMLGTPIGELLAHAGFHAEQADRVLHGGPMMGFAVTDLAMPVVKITNCILAPTRSEIPPPQAQQPCIRCGMCAEACPASLLPQQLYWYARAKDQEQLERHNLMDCIECGACAYVCPSHIPLVQYYRSAKGALREAVKEQVRSDNSRGRFEARQTRLEQEAAAREAKRAARKAAAEARAQAGDDPVQAAIERAKAKKAQQEESS